MSGVATSVTGSLPTAAQSTSSSKSTTAIIVVASVGGFLFVVALVLVLVPFARRRALKRRSNPKKDAKSSTLSSGTSTTGQSRPEVANRTISVDASVPLLESDPTTSPEYSRFKSTSDMTAQSSIPRTLNPDSRHFPRRFAPSFKSFSAARPSSPDLEPGLSRSFLSPPQPPLRHARTRVARVLMDPLPEDTVPDGTPQRVPSPTATSTESHAPAPTPTSWLHIPKASGIPLIGAFRGSISSLASAASSSLPTMQHYPSFSQNVQSASASTKSSQTFYTVASDGPGPTAGRNLSPPASPPPPPSEQSEIPLPGSAAWLKRSGVGERIPQVHLNPSDAFHASRQASMVYSQKSSMLSIPGGLRPGENGRPQSSTVASGSSMSLYTDARSQVGVGEDGRWDGSVGGSSSGGARGRKS
ncbi:hypothetical protein BC826DRAFT_1107551 [Russula brevipes]|nr:hypothetical protein BC826DRAFT_1107551 [Russula brevipes]